MPESLPEANLVTETEAARILAVAPGTLRRWRGCGRGPIFKKIGGCVRYDRRQLDEFLDGCDRASTAEYAVRKKTATKPRCDKCGSIRSVLIKTEPDADGRVAYCRCKACLHTFRCYEKNAR